jgi:acetyl/propionyl-CoA carboxylase alpha subunit
MVETTLIKKVLIANRGEIAVRIIQACRELGIETAAIYSEVDRTALHVRQADEAYLIGGPRPSESYLVIDKVLEAAKRAGADAIHPGYGFLAERADFAQACLDEGLIFIGPRPHSIGMMGDKLAARETMRKAGVPLIPGTRLGLRDDEMLAVAEGEVGFPLMVKAAAGAGARMDRPPSGDFPRAGGGPRERKPPLATAPSTWRS